MKKIALLLTFLMFFVNTALAENKFTFKFDEGGYISDGANVLQESDKERMTYWLDYLEKRKHVALVLVTLEDLKGAPASQVAHYALEYGGKAKKDDTLIFVVSPFENKFGIEMGENLKSEISYVTLRRIITEDIYPHFQDGNYSFALKNGIFSISSVIEPSLIFVRDVDLTPKNTVVVEQNTNEHNFSLNVFKFLLTTILILLIISFITLRILYFKKHIKIYRRCGFGITFGKVSYEEC